MKEINNIDITLTKGMLCLEKSFLKTYMITHGRKNYTIELFIFSTGDSSSPK